MDTTKLIFVIHIKNEYNPRKAEKLFKLLSKEKRAVITKYNDETAKKESLYANAALKHIIEKEYGISINEITVVKNEKGKPYIKDHSEIYFNISHTDKLIAIALSSTEVGVDVEGVGCPNIKIAKRFFTAEECDYIYSDNANSSKRFAEIWTKKEAYVKCSGIGLRTPLNGFCVFDEAFENKFKTFEIGDYIISFYDGEPDNKISLVEISEEEIENI